MPQLFLQRCLNHGTREAVARCPDCGRFFCRECITEHENRVICASCLVKLDEQKTKRLRGVYHLLGLARFGLGLVVAWFFFHLIGSYLLSRPAAFHEQTLWQQDWFSSE